MNIDKKILLVLLQLIIVLVMSMIVEGMLNGEGPAESSRSSSSRLYPTPRKKNNTRYYRLYHELSEGQIVIRDKVNTNRNYTDMFGALALESNLKNNTITIRIRGTSSQKYVCYNRRGTLIAKPPGRARGSKCEFTEEQDGPHFRYTSAYNPAWVMGFNRKGSPVRGGDRRPNNLYKFIKQQLEDPDSPQTSRKTSSPHTSRHVRRRGQHNRRDVLKVNFNYAPNQVHMRHSKKSHRPRNRQTHFHSERDDR